MENIWLIVREMEVAMTRNTTVFDRGTLYIISRKERAYKETETQDRIKEDLEIICGVSFELVVTE